MEIENHFVHRDSFNLMCDQLIGSGIARQVFSSKLFPKSVIKVEVNAGSFQNIIEYEVWQRIQYTKLAEWFAPCEYISPNGSILIQAKTSPVPYDAYPEEMPVFMTDFKRENYGFYNGHIVCHDYGTCLLFEHGMSKRMKKPKWWDAT